MTRSAAPDVFYVQFANPAAYPPVLHGARLLADAGRHVRMLGAGMDGSASLRVPPHPRIDVRQLPLAPVGWRRRVQYGRFVALALREIARTRPAWVYASDPFSAPVAAVARRLGLARVVYHEHDAPAARPASAFMRVVYTARRAAVRTADLLVVPNEERLAALVAASGRTGPSVCVWNVPAADEVGPPRPPADGPLTLYYHGSLNEERLPFAVLDAMARVAEPLRLHAVGYETVGSLGFTANFLAAARRLGVADRVRVDGPADRADVMASARQADVGLALMPMATDEPNMQAMAGASNKAFDYLAGGLALVVTDLPEWCRLYVEPGYGLAADPTDSSSLADVFSRLVADPTATRQMGEAGRHRILSDWNYDNMYSYVVNVIERK